MSIVTFWSNSREQVGKTLTSVSVATQMAIQHNFKVLLLSTSFSDTTIKNCFWVDNIQKKLKLYEQGNNIAVESGMEGLIKLIKSNKIQPNIITDYTKVIFKGRLEVLAGFSGSVGNTLEENQQKYRELGTSFVELVKIANQYYDMVLVDLSTQLDALTRKQILEISNLNVQIISQRLSSINRYKELREKNRELQTPKNITAIGKYDSRLKYNLKNISRYLGTKEKISVVPYNVLFYEAAEEAGVPELFLRLRKLTDVNDINYIFISETLNLTNLIVNRLKELQMKMR